MPIALTLLRLLLVVPTLYALEEDRRGLAFLLVLIAGLTDFFDGRLARKNNNISKLGALLDPFVDKVFVLSVLSFFLYNQEIGLLPFLLLLFRELTVSFLRSLAVEKGYLMSASYLGKTKAFFEFLTLMFLCLDSSLSNILLWISITFAYLSMYDYLVKYATFERVKQ